MTGKKAFDEMQVLRAALNVFRLKGYAGAGLSELEAATGLNRSSLYNAYGSKQGLFVRTLILFREVITEMARDHTVGPACITVHPGAAEALEAHLREAGERLLAAMEDGR